MNNFFCIMMLLILSLALIGCEKTPAVTVDLGAGTSILVPVPEGFRALRKENPAFMSYIQDRSADLVLEDFLTEKDYSDVMAGKSEQRDRELRMMSSPSVWTADFDEASFRGQTQALRAVHPDVQSMTSKANDELKDLHKKNGGDVIEDSSPSPVEQLFDEPYAVGVMGCFTLTKSGTPSRECSAQVELLVRRRIVSLYVMATIRNESDVDWVRSTARLWTSNIYRENRPGGGHL